MIYQYLCVECENYEEVFMTMQEYEEKKHSVPCSKCGEFMKRIYSAPDFYVKMGVCGNQNTGYYDWVYHYVEGNTSYKNKGCRK